MIYRQSSTANGDIPNNFDYFNGQLTPEDIQILTSGSKFLNNYVHNAHKQSNFYDNKHEMVGGNRTKDFDQYFNTISKYVSLIK